MKRSIAIAICITAVLVCLLSVTAAASNVTLDRISACIREQRIGGCDISVLTKTRSVKGTIEIAEDEYLVIPSGKRLILNGGAVVDGDIYIESGGQLNIMDGEVLLSGSVVCDGKLTVNARAEMTIGGSLYIARDGTLKLGGDNVFCTSSASAVCLGTTNSTLKELGTVPIAAVISEIVPMSGRVQSNTTVVEDLNELIPEKENYYTADELPTGASTERVTFLFDSGACVTAERCVGEKYCSVGGVDVRLAHLAINNEAPEADRGTEEAMDMLDDPIALDAYIEEILPAYLDSEDNEYSITSLYKVQNNPNLSGFTSGIVFVACDGELIGRMDIHSRYGSLYSAFSRYISEELQDLYQAGEEIGISVNGEATFIVYDGGAIVLEGDETAQYDGPPVELIPLSKTRSFSYNTRTWHGTILSTESAEADRGT